MEIEIIDVKKNPTTNLLNACSYVNHVVLQNYSSSFTELGMKYMATWSPDFSIPSDSVEYSIGLISVEIGGEIYLARPATVLEAICYLMQSVYVSSDDRTVVAIGEKLPYSTSSEGVVAFHSNGVDKKIFMFLYKSMWSTHFRFIVVLEKKIDSN